MVAPRRMCSMKKAKLIVGLGAALLASAAIAAIAREASRAATSPTMILAFMGDIFRAVCPVIALPP